MDCVSCKEQLEWRRNDGAPGEGFAFALKAEGTSQWQGDTTILHRDAGGGGFHAAVRADLSSRYIAFNPQALARARTGAVWIRRLLGAAPDHQLEILRIFAT